MEKQKEWWLNPLADDIHTFFLAQEKNIPLFKAQSPQLHLRRFLVDWLAVVCDQVEICLTARHLAVYFMDYFMDNYDIDETQLHLVAIGCLLVASKYEEQESKIPRAVQLNKFVSNCQGGYPLHMYLQMELTLLQFFHWNVSMTTAAHLIDYYMKFSVEETDYHGDRLILCLAKAQEYVLKYANYFLEISLQDYKFRYSLPSNVASACIAASRICLHLSPTWTVHLQKVTGYCLEKIMPCVELMLKAHQVDELAMNNPRLDGSASDKTSVVLNSPHNKSVCSLSSNASTPSPYMMQVRPAS
ncbi:cyclin-J [Lingula anatina]|uniref:Cyclin-J n=1 Tax=Lingula anatina TaxID=7574 RepID=A0A1S3IJW9_LINAN|nr:cyclin-J [Lingula anatina]|eukprot:XP_013397814.1 cyclin-J [Lingula anatina]